MPYPLLHSNDIEVLRDQFAAWMEGATAAARGELRLAENPHAERSRRADAWEHAFESISSALRDHTAATHRRQ
jgi:hypothetical protein